MERPHALVFPSAAQGHINPLMQLSQHLVASHGFLITFVNTEHNHLRIMEARKLSNEEDHPDIRMVGISDGLPLDDFQRTSDLKKIIEAVHHHMVPLVEQLMSEINQKSNNPINCIISDLFMHWMHDIAAKMKIPTVIGFCPASIATFSLVYHIPLLLSSGKLNHDGKLCLAL